VDALGGQDVGLLAAGEVIRFGAVGAGIFAAADAQHTDAPAVIGVPVADGNGYHAAVVRLLGESAATADAAVAGTVPALVAGFAQLFQARAVLMHGRQAPDFLGHVRTPGCGDCGRRKRDFDATIVPRMTWDCQKRASSGDNLGSAALQLGA